MSRVLLTGVSGTGKSSVIRALRHIGHMAIDMDEPGWSMHNTEGHQIWHESRLTQALEVSSAGHLFVSGCAENQVNFYPRFNQIILMWAPVDLIKARLAMRSDNHYGKRPEELEQVLHDIAWVEPLLRHGATHEIDTTIPLDQVVASVLVIAGASPGAP